MSFSGRSIRWLIPVLFLFLTVARMAAQSANQHPTGDAASTVTSGQLFQRVAPVYPPLARNAGIEGDVVVDAIIGADGTVNSATAVRGDPFLTQAAVDAVRQWRYKPSDAEGRTQVTVSFSLKSPGAPDATNAAPTGKETQASTASTAESNPQGAAHSGAPDTSKTITGDIAELKKHADSGDAQAQYDLGYAYANGEGISKDEAEAARWYRKAADQGGAEAQIKLGYAYGTGQGVPRDNTEAVRWYRKAAEQGDAGGQYNLGLAYALGLGVTKDKAEAVRWYRKSAGQGLAEAENNLGVAYHNGEGISKDEREAAHWMRKAADQGNPLAEYSLGKFHDNGQGVAKNEVEAARWYRKAAEQGYVQAQHSLGDAYYKGRGVAKDEAEAVRWYRKAAEQGYADAQYAVGRAYATGKGVSQNKSAALEWFRSAAKLGNDDAATERDALYVELGTPEGKILQGNDAASAAAAHAADQQSAVNAKVRATKHAEEARQAAEEARQAAIDAPREQFARSITNVYRQRLRANGADPNRASFEAYSKTYTARDANWDNKGTIVSLVVESNQIGLPNGSQDFLQGATWTSRAYALGFRGVRLADDYADCDFLFVNATTIRPIKCITQAYPSRIIRQWPDGYVFKVK